MHLDYSIHPITKKERRVNLIVYLNPRWEKDWGGNLELWNSEFTKCEKEVAPEFNTGVLFQTSDISYHGLPRPIRSPDVARRLIPWLCSPPSLVMMMMMMVAFSLKPGL